VLIDRGFFFKKKRSIYLGPFAEKTKETSWPKPTIAAGLPPHFPTDHIAAVILPVPATVRSPDDLIPPTAAPYAVSDSRRR
jgi:hypothetical protein